MLKNKLTKLFAILFIGLSVNMAVLPTVYALSNSAPVEFFQASGDPAADAMAAANMESTGIWFAAGCLLGLVGLLISYLVEPKPSAIALVGKSPEYVAVYSDVYSKEVKAKNTKAAMTGCLIGTAVSVALNVALVAAAADAETN